MKVIATVNGFDINQDVLDRSVSRYIVQLEEDDTAEFEANPQNMKFIKTEVLNHLVERTLLLKRAENAGISIDHKAVKINLDKMKANFDTDQDWKDNLILLRIEEETLFNEIHDDMMIDQFLAAQLESKVEFTEAELKEYYQRNEEVMKEPDLFSFYEIFTNQAEQVKIAVEILNSEPDRLKLEEKLNKADLELHHHTNVPNFQLPEEVFNVLKDLEVLKIGMMQSPGGGMLVYKLIRKILGNKLPFDQIKQKLAEFLIKAARNDILDKIIAEELEKAAIEYKDTEYLES